MSSAETFDGAEEVRRAWMAGLAPDPSLTVSQWADRHRVLSSRAASEAGPYRTSRTPYMKAVMDALSPRHPAQRVVFMKAAQVGATEAGNNWIGFCMHRAPGPCLAVQPTVDLAKRLSQQRIDPLIEESPDLRALVLPSRSRDAGNTILGKRFPGGQLILTGANSAVGLRSMPARWVFLDEVDAYPGDVDGEGDPIALAEARTISFGHRSKVFLASTPTLKGLSRIEREWELSDQQRYHVPCPHCGGLQWLQFERLRWDQGKAETVQYFCEHCDAPIAERHKTWMMAEENGAGWLPTAAPEVQAAATDRGKPGIAGSHAIFPVALQMVEEGPDHWRIKIVDVELARRLAALLRREDQEQPQGVAIGLNRVRADLALADKAIGEERLQGRGERTHASPPKWRSSISPASPSNSGAADRYQ